jgi:hypothetical protein
MAASADWVSDYKANRGDGGTIEALCAFDDEELAEISKGHNNDAGKLRATIARSGGGNILLVNFLHQGFATTTHLGGDMILGFVQGKFTTSPSKVIGRPADAVVSIDHGRSATRGKTAPAACPTLVAIFGAGDEDAFVALPGEVDTLANRPNHLFVHPRMFTKSDGPKSVRSKTLAWHLIENLTEGLIAAESDQERAEIEEEQDNVGTLLAFLWASEQGLLTPVTLTNIPESPHLNHQSELIVKKISAITAPTGKSLDLASRLAVATHNLVMLSMQSTETTRQNERAEDKSAKSLIRSLSPKQQAQFTKLCTGFPSIMPSGESPHRATNLVAHESRMWKGTFSASGLSRFLAGGCVSQEGSQGEPDGFTAFMFHPLSLF